MHDLNLIENIFTIILDEARKRKMSSIKSAQLEVGKMNGLRRRDFEMAIKANKNESLASMNISIKDTPVRLECSHCGANFTDDRFDDFGFAHATSHAPYLYIAPSCPSCKKEGAKVISGRELRLVSIEG